MARLGQATSVAALTVAAEVAGVLDRHKPGEGSITLEVTESAMMCDPEQALRTITEISRMGVRFSIDDFGTGYSSLGYLKKLPVVEIKIDRSFVRDMEQDGDDATIVQSTIDLAHNLGLQVVAEGVETEQRNHGITEAAGVRHWSGLLHGAASVDTAGI